MVLLYKTLNSATAHVFRKKKIKKKSFRMYLNSISMVWLEWSLFKKRSHMAMMENCRLRLLVIKSSTAHEGVRYFNPPVSHPACRENAPAHPAHSGAFVSVLFVEVVLCEDVPGWGFSCFTFWYLQRRRAEHFPIDLGELDFCVLKDDTSFWVNCKNCQKTFKVRLYNCLLYISRLASAFTCLVLRTRVYSASCLSKHWKFGSSIPDKTSGSSGLVSCLWQ